MPCYSYECKHCNKVFEDLQLFEDCGTGKCPDCLKISRKRVFDVPSAVVEGSERTFGSLAEANNRRIGNSNVAKEIAKQQTKKTDSYRWDQLKNLQKKKREQS